MIKQGKSYVCDTSDLKVHVLSIRYKCDEYVKIKCVLSNRYNGIVYDDKANFKLYFDKISHWKECDNS